MSRCRTLCPLLHRAVLHHDGPPNGHPAGRTRGSVVRGTVEAGAVIRPPGDADALPYGCQWVGVEVNSPADLATLDLPEGALLEARVATPGALPEGLPPHRLLVSSIPGLEAWLDSP